MHVISVESKLEDPSDGVLIVRGNMILVSIHETIVDVND